MKNSLYGLNGDFALGYKLLLPEKYSLGKEDFDLLNTTFSKTLRDLPTNTIFLKQDVFKKEKIDTSLFEERNFLERDRKEHFEKFNYVNHEIYIFFILPNKIIKNKQLKNPFRPPNKKVYKEYDDRVDDFITVIKQSIDYLNNVKLSDGNLSIKPLDEKTMKEYYSYYMSGYNSEVGVELKKEWKYLQVGNKYASILRFPHEKEFPKEFKTHISDDKFASPKIQFFKGYGDNFGFDLKFDHVYNQIAFIDEPRLHLEEVKKNSKRLEQTGFIDRDNKRLAKVTSEIVDELSDSTNIERLIRAHINLVVFANSENELEFNINKSVSKFKEIDIKPIRLYGNNLLAVYEYSYPLNSSYFIESHLFVCSTRMFSCFIILAGIYKDDKVGVYFNSRLENVPVKVDLWDAEKEFVKARNAIIVAPTGEGKSVTANHIITNCYAEGEKQVIIDLGASYRKIASVFKEDTAYISYVEGESLGINPFVLTKYDLFEERISNNKLEELTEFIAVHYKRAEGIDDLERTAIRKIVELYYQETNEDYSFQDFIKFFREGKERIYKELEIEESFLNPKPFLFLLEDFGEKGVYSSLYKKSDNEILSSLENKKIIIFELDSIRENKGLLIVMLQLIFSIIIKVIWKDKKTRGRIWFDEVAEQLQWDGMLARIQWYYQAIRKYEGAVTIILQAVSQLPEHTLSKSIIENTNILYVLKAKNYKPIQERFSLSEHAFYQMSSLNSNFNTERGYSEIFIVRGAKHQVYRLELPKKTYWAYQTEGKKNERLMEIYESSNGMEDAINKYLTENSKS